MFKSFLWFIMLKKSYWTPQARFYFMEHHGGHGLEGWGIDKIVRATNQSIMPYNCALNQDPTCIDVSSLVPSRRLRLGGLKPKGSSNTSRTNRIRVPWTLMYKRTFVSKTQAKWKISDHSSKDRPCIIFHKLVSPRSRNSMSKNLSWPIQIKWIDTYIELYVLNQYISNIFFYSYFRG